MDAQRAANTPLAQNGRRKLPVVVAIEWLARAAVSSSLVSFEIHRMEIGLPKYDVECDGLVRQQCAKAVSRLHRHVRWQIDETELLCEGRCVCERDALDGRLVNADVAKIDVRRVTGDCAGSEVRHYGQRQLSVSREP